MLTVRYSTFLRILAWIAIASTLASPLWLFSSGYWWPGVCFVLPLILLAFSLFISAGMADRLDKAEAQIRDLIDEQIAATPSATQPTAAQPVRPITKLSERIK